LFLGGKNKPMNRRGRAKKASHPPTSMRKTRNPEHRMFAGSTRLDVNGWIFVRVRGAPYQLGFQHGSLLANEVGDAIEAVKLIAELGYRRTWQFFCEAAMNLFWPKLPQEYKDEIHGIVAGVRANKTGNVRLEDIVALNGYFDILSYHYWLKAKKAEPASPLARADHCSAFIATGGATEDGRVVLAHNTWFQYLPGRRYNTILDVSPAKGTRFVMQTMPGTIASGTDWYLNQTGLIIAETTITGMTTFNPNGLPCFLRSRKAIQYSETIDEWVKTMVTENNGGYADDWLVGDTRTGEIARLELGTFNHKLERTRSGAFLGSNLALSDEVRSETTFNYSDRSTTCTARYGRLEELLRLNKGKLNVEVAKLLLADHHDNYTHTDTPNRNTICGHIESDGRGLPEWEYGPNYPGGTFDGKITDSKLASHRAFWAHWGKPCGASFAAEPFLVSHPEYEWQRPHLEDIEAYPWTLFSTSGKRNMIES
jgi:hypothetical protein